MLVLATLWPQFWDGLTARPEGGADPHAQARELLAGHDITVPAAFAPAHLQRLSQAGDTRLAQAAAGAQDGQVIQFLAGAPELLSRYRNAPPGAKALINAAMDARRLGMGIALPHAFLEAAAPGYLTDTEWHAQGGDWLEQALAYTAVPCKGVRGPLTRIRPRPAGSRAPGSRDSNEQLAGGPVGTPGGPLYRLADYLEQHGRRTRQDQLGPPSLWDALTAQAATARDRTRLGQAARDRGLYHRAAALWTTAATLGSADAARRLITLLYQISPGDTARAAHWAASHVRIDDLFNTAALLRALRAAGADDAVTALASRAAGQASLDDPRAVAWLLEVLREAGARHALTTMLDRDPASQASLDDPRAVRSLLRVLRAAGADETTVTGLASRAADQASLDDLGPSPSCCGNCAGPGPTTRSLPWPAGPPGRPASTTRGPSPRSCGSCARPWLATPSLPCWTATPPGRPASTTQRASARCCRRCARPGPATPSLPWPAGPPGRPASRIRRPSARCCRYCVRTGPTTRSLPWPAGPPGSSLEDPEAVRSLLQALREDGADDAVHTLLARDPAGQASLESPFLESPVAVAWQLQELRGRRQRRDHRPGQPGRRPGRPRRPIGCRLAAAGAARGRGRRRGPYAGQPGRRRGHVRSFP